MELQWSLILFTALTGSAGWMLACLAVDEIKGITKSKDTRFLVALVAIIVLALGGVASVTHLSHPERVMGALGHPTSGIFIEICLVSLAGLCNLIYLIVNKRVKDAVVVSKVFAVLAAVFGVVLSFMAGESYMMSSQPAWDTFIMPVGYLCTTIPVGISAYMLVITKRKEKTGFFNGFLFYGSVLAAIVTLVFACMAGKTSVAAIVFCIVAVIGLAIAAVCGFNLNRKPVVVKDETAAAVEVEESADEVIAAENEAEPAKKGKMDRVLLIMAVAVAGALVGAVCYRCLMWAVGTGINNFFGLI